MPLKVTVRSLSGSGTALSVASVRARSNVRRLPARITIAQSDRTEFSFNRGRLQEVVDMLGAICVCECETHGERFAG